MVIALKYNSVDKIKREFFHYIRQPCWYYCMDAPLGLYRNVWIKSRVVTMQVCCVPYWTNPGISPPTKQVYDHLPPISKTVQDRRTKHAEHCWWTKDELMSGLLYGLVCIDMVVLVAFISCLQNLASREPVRSDGRYGRMARIKRTRFFMLMLISDFFFFFFFFFLGKRVNWQSNLVKFSNRRLLNPSTRANCDTRSFFFSLFLFSIA